MARKFFVLMCLLLALCAGVEAAAAKTLEPKVVSVYFYPHGAKIVFQLELDRKGDFEGVDDPISPWL